MSKIIYLDNAATSWPKPENVYRAMDLFLREKGANPGRASYGMAIEAHATIEQTRTLVKRFFYAQPGAHVIFTLNCTDALNMALKGLLRPGDHVITSVLEHNSVYRPLNKLKETRGITYSLVSPNSDGLIEPGEVKKMISPKTRLICLTHASNVTGALQPVAEMGKIASENGIFFLLDAAQTAGAIPIHMREMKIDLLACPGHKGLLGPPGTGLLIINEGVELDSFREGGTGSASQEPHQPSFYPDRMEAGTFNTVGIAGLKAGIDFLSGKGLEKVREHEKFLTGILLKGLSDIPGVSVYGPTGIENKTGLVSFNIEGYDSLDVTAILESHFGIACRSGLHCAPLVHRSMGTFPAGTVRFSTGFFNTGNHISAALEAVSALSGAQL